MGDQRQPQSRPGRPDGGRTRARAAQSEDSAPDDHDDATPESSPSEPRGVGRRALLAAGALAATGVGVGGWFAFARDAADRGDPVAASERSWALWAAGDADAYRETFHSDSPERDQPYWSDDDHWADFGPADDAAVTLDATELVSRDGGRATVEETYRWNAPDSDPTRITNTVDLRTEDGDWKLWRIQFVAAEPVDEST